MDWDLGDVIPKLLSQQKKDLPDRRIRRRQIDKKKYFFFAMGQKRRKKPSLKKTELLRRDQSVI